MSQLLTWSSVVQLFEEKLLINQHASRKHKNALIEPAKYGAVSFVADLWTDNVVSHSYLDVTFFWVKG